MEILLDYLLYFIQNDMFYVLSVIQSILIFKLCRVLSNIKKDDVSLFEDDLNSLLEYHNKVVSVLEKKKEEYEKNKKE